MSRTKLKDDNYSLVIYQSPKNRKKVYLQLRKGGKTTPDRIYGGFKEVALRTLLLVQYARANEVDFKEAWDSDEVWV